MVKIRNPVCLNVFVCAAILAFAGALPVSAQATPPIPLDINENDLMAIQGSAVVEVHVRELEGTPLPVDATVHLIPYVPVTTQSANHYDAVTKRGIGTIRAVDGGEYLLEVTATGYQTHRERISVLPGYGQTTRAFVVMSPSDGTEDITLEQPGAPPVNAGVRRDMQMAVMDVQMGHPEKANDRIKNALKHAPNSPDVHFLAGYLDDSKKDYAGAEKEYAEAVKDFPSHVAAQLGLGSDLIHDNKAAEAIPHLEKAIDLAPNSWRAHWLLAEAYLQTTKDTAKVKFHARRAYVLSKQTATGPLVTIAIADAVSGDLKTSQQELEDFLKDHPKDQNADRARQFLANVKEAEAAPPGRTVAVPATVTASDVGDLENIPPEAMPGLPPDVDSAAPPVAEGETCELRQVLAGAALRARELADNLERFSATELVMNDDLDAKGTSRKSVQRSFSYVAILERPKTDMIVMDELHDGQYGVANFDVPLMMEGIPAIGLVFNAVFQQDFNFTCEGLGQWKGQPAWQIRFEQRSDRPSRMHDWTIDYKTYHTNLKGRAWLSSGDFQLLHVDTDLMNPITDLKLEYQHMAIDYQPASFPDHKKALWLPSGAQIYCKYRGHYFRQEHDLSNFTLFSTGTQENIGTKPRQPKQQPPKD